MKILHYSDQASPDFFQLYNQCDVLVSTGDLTYFDFTPLQDIKDKKPAFGVYGNHDSGKYLENLGLANLHNQVVEFAGMRWGGFQGCLRYKPSELMFSEEDAKEFADNFPSVDILLLHAGPQGMLDDPSDEVHIGSQHIRRYVLEKKPRFVFVGHQYSNADMQVDSTVLYRTYGARLIQL